MRIAIWHNLPSGGGKRALYDQIRGLVARGHYVESWCPPTADQDFLSIGDLVPEHVAPLDRVDGLNWRALASRIKGGGTSIPAQLNALDKHSRRCAAEITERAFDVVLAEDSIQFATTSLARYLTVPAVLYLQQPCRPLYEALPRLPWPALDNERPLRPSVVRARLRDASLVRAFRIQAREELLGVEAYDLVLTNSRFSWENIARTYGVDSSVCYLGVDTARFWDWGRPRKRTIVGIGAFRSHKRIDVIIDAIARMKPPRPSMIWVGNAVDSDYLYHLVHLADRRRVTFEPRINVSHEEVVRILNEASLMAYAPWLEPFGYAPLEAAASGLPVVARAEGGVRETVADGVTGILVDSDDALPVAFERVLEDEDLARRMGTAGRRWVESRWSLESATQRLESHLLSRANVQ